MKKSNYLHFTNREKALSILTTGLKVIQPKFEPGKKLTPIQSLMRARTKNSLWAILESRKKYIKEYIESADTDPDSVLFFFTAPSIGEKGGPEDENDDGQEGYVRFINDKDPVIPPENFYKVRINSINYTPKEALGILKRKTEVGSSESTDELIELTLNQLKELDLDKEFWEIGNEVKKPEVIKGSSIYVLKDGEKVVAIIVVQKKQIKVLQSIKKGYGTKIVSAIIKKLGKSLKVKEAVRGAINFYYKMGFELDRNYLDTRNGNTINMTYHNKLSDKLSSNERIKNDIDFLENEIEKIKKDYDVNMQRRILGPYIRTINNLKMVAK